jgi:hypothetical protein
MSESGVDPQVAMEKLASLESSAAVAQFLVGERIQGYRSMATSCPVAQYLRRETGQQCEVHMNKFFNKDWSYEVPLNVGIFVYDFDKGKYPDLEFGD